MHPRVRSDFLKIAKQSKDARTIAQITEHYLLERSLAKRLMLATETDRKHRYGEVYTELFANLSHHPQHHSNYSGPEYISRQSILLRKLIQRGSVFVEIGAGDARLSIDMSDYCAWVTAVDVTDILLDKARLPSNFRFLTTDGTHIDLPDNSVDFVYSNQLMEHLHPADARTQLAEIYRILKSGGKYFCITPNINSGPHDISKYFDYFATGFHLREYSYGSLADEMRLAGFKTATPILIRKGGFWSMPLWAAKAIEVGIRAMERLTCQSFRSEAKIRALLGVNMMAVK